MRRVYDEIAEEKLPQEKKQNLLLNLKQKMQTQAEREVAELVGKCRLIWTGHVTMHFGRN